jgi:hypothetical protein
MTIECFMSGVGPAAHVTGPGWVAVVILPSSGGLSIRYSGPAGVIAGVDWAAVERAIRCAESAELERRSDIPAATWIVNV